MAGTAWFVFNELRINPFQVNKSLATGVRDENSQGSLSVPSDFQLEPIYPNPFQPGSRGAVNIHFSLNRATVVRLSVYNLLGHKIKVLSDSNLPASDYIEHWYGTNQEGLRVTAGLYFIVLKTENQIAIRKMVLFR